MFRSFFLYLSASTGMRRTLTSLPFATRLSRRFVAGETLDDAINVVRALNAKGMLGSLDHLGENVHTQAHSERATQAYIDLLNSIPQAARTANGSLKLTAPGPDISESLCIPN